MQTDIRAEGFELTAALQAHAQRRLEFALLRFRTHLASVCMRLTDDNGPRGGVDKRCMVRVRLPGLPPVVINELSEDLYVAIDRATERAARTVARRLARQERAMHGREPAGQRSKDLGEPVDELRAAAR